MSHPNSNKQAIRGQQRARKFALQALYQWDMAATPLHCIEEQFHEVNDMQKVDVHFFHEILHGVPQHLDELQILFKPYLDRDIEALSPIELTVLRIATYELLYQTHIPYRIILDEAISLTKTFGSQDGYRYINGILNHVARKVRVSEIN